MKWSLDNLSWLYQQSPVPHGPSVQFLWLHGLPGWQGIDRANDRQPEREREKDRNPRTSLLSRWKKKNCSGLCYKVGPRLQECFRQVEADVVRNTGTKFTKPGNHFSAHPCRREERSSPRPLTRSLRMTVVKWDSANRLALPLSRGFWVSCRDVM